MIKPEITKQCSFCGANFTASKSTATFCSNTCRTKACVKRKHDDQVNAEIEAQRLQEQERLQQKADARRLKREQKAVSIRFEQEKQAEMDRQAKDSIRIQREKNAVDLVIKHQKELDDIQKLKDKKTDDDKQSRERKERLKKLLKDSKDKKNQYDKNVQVGKGMLILGVGALVYLALKKPKEESSPTIEHPEPGEFPKIELPKVPLKTVKPI